MDTEQSVDTIAKQVQDLPMKPGVYQFFDAAGKLLYVGKAVKLRSRVQSYFRSSTNHSPAKQFMVGKIADIKTITVDTEAEALLLETTLIKKHKPPYNIVMKDDKNFQYIHITDDPFPRIETVRQLPRLGTRRGKYFGPYVSGFAVKKTLRTMQTVFRYCTTPPEVKRGVVVYPKRPCLQYQLGRCIGPCAQAISQEEYQALFRDMARMLSGETDAVIADLQQQMRQASEAKRFEKAATIRDQLQALDRLFFDQKVVDVREQSVDVLSLARVDDTAAVNVFIVRHGRLIAQNVFLLRHVKDQSDDDVLEAFQDQYYQAALEKPKDIMTNRQERRGKNKQLLEMGEANALQALEQHLARFEKEDTRAKKALAELAAALETTPEKLHRIEVYDISHNQGAYTVASMIVFIDGRPAPSEYRKFKIRSARGTGKSDDFASMREVINRRVKHIKRKQKEIADPWPTPSLIVIDGGKGQLSSAKAMLDVAHLDIPIISLAKRIEEIFLPENSTPILLPRDSQGLYLMQRMRDEAHRFAIGFYRKRHLAGLV